MDTPIRTFPSSLAIAALAAALGAACWPAVAVAHQYWLSPSSYEAVTGRPIDLGAIAGTGFRGERKPWSPPLALRFVAETARSVDLTRAASPGELVWARFAPSDPGGAMVAFESGFSPIELPGPQFNAYLEDEGLDAPLAARRGAVSQTPGRERYRRCAKAWLAGADLARATRPVGLPLEIVPLTAPGRDATLRVRVLWNGRALAGALVKTWRAPLSTQGAPQDGESRDSVAVCWQGRTSASGELSIPAREAGEWLVSVVHMEPSADRREADWESTWASLTFERPAGGAERKRT